MRYLLLFLIFYTTFAVKYYKIAQKHEFNF